MLPQVGSFVSPDQPDFRLQSGESKNTLQGITPRELLPVPRDTAFPVDVAAILAEASTTIPPLEDVTMPIDRKSIFAAALGTALSVSSVMADDDKKIPDSKKIEVTTTQATDLKKDLDEVKDLLKKLTERQKDLDTTVTGQATKNTDITKQIADMAASVKTLEESFQKLDKKVSDVGETLEKVRTANSSPLNSDKDKKVIEAKKEGIIKLINQYGDAVTVILNGKPHKLGVGETKDISLPIGSFDYALPLAGGEIKTSQVKADEIVTLKVK
jgi:vacuolar-type H+-ATPase subunit E/Vma4